MNIIGNWEGYYEYGEGYSLPQFGERVEISVIFQGSNDKFIGTVNEKPSDHSIPLEATIQGFTENELISFVKHYPKAPRIKEHGSSEIVFEQGQLEIEHMGFIDTSHNSMYGTWTITQNMEDELGIFEVTTYGIWLLRKAH